MSNIKAEVWLRGPLPQYPALLQPIGHALLQAKEELAELMIDFPEDLLFERLTGLASPAFHIQHLTGVLDRLFTYARKESLSEVQLLYLKKEKDWDKDLSIEKLVAQFDLQVAMALLQLAKTAVNELTETRLVGRDKIPSTLIGLYTHAAEHTMRHIGQLLVTVKVLKGKP
ncbi:MAG: DinB family protein [Bacteroidetes bacterium]|nr:DinB family protein [Bacteroidota bacterium]MBU1373389.1 DinB family protein [Bacteroidota bacterium]MBU1483907.1 DinB family protein [Bacteroidota bacterium]MBU1759877.1 DinB family protein [Bacteroidota bacterium]MBU2046318.1 DinB family protein [Bacteroidota bacterium]